VPEEVTSVLSFVIFRAMLPDILEYLVVQTKENEMIGRSKRRGKDEICVRMKPLSNISRLIVERD
jgi:hypothetical protein